MAPKKLLLFLKFLQTAFLANPALLQDRSLTESETSLEVQNLFFQDFIQRFDIQITSVSEFNYRKKIFFRKKQEIEVFNSLDSSSYRKGLNGLSHLSFEEKRQLLGDSNLLRGPRPLFQARSDGSLPFGSLGQSEGEIALRQNLFVPYPKNFDGLFDFIQPQAKDFEAEGKLTPVKEQRQCASDWAMAATALVEAAFKAKYGSIHELAAQELLDCAGALGSQGCSGGLVQDALEYIRDKGVRYEVEYPYRARDGDCRPGNMNESKRLIRSFVGISAGNILAFLANLRFRPIAVSFYVPEAFFDYASGIFDAEVECTGVAGSAINHAAMAVGFDLASDVSFIKLQNSWGEKWGERGFFKLPLKRIVFQNGPCNLLQKDRSFYVVLD